jgi:hypothetical protein
MKRETYVIRLCRELVDVLGQLDLVEGGLGEGGGRPDDLERAVPFLLQVVDEPMGRVSRA